MFIIIIAIILTQACTQIPSVTLLILYNMDKSLKYTSEGFPVDSQIT